MANPRNDQEIYEEAWLTAPPMPPAIRAPVKQAGKSRTRQHATPAAINAAAAGDFANALAASLPGGIEAQEAAGQRDLVDGQMIPRKMQNATREQLEKIGFVFGKNVDELFVNVLMPKGWKMEATDHSMHSNMLDKRGVCRAQIFYKAAFYDRRADITILSRYFLKTEYVGRHRRVLVIDRDDGDKTIYASDIHDEHDYKTGDKARDAAEKWLAKRHPKHGDPFAYWGKKRAS